MRTTICLGVVAVIGGCTTRATAWHDQAIVAGAGYTTFDATQGGCNDSPNGVNCNNYVAKEDVYMSGGPSGAGLSDGSYSFAVLAPGAQNGGFVDGAIGNLSSGWDGAGDRTFVVVNHDIVGYAGSHALGTSPNGRTIIQLAPFDDTPNPGGVYILAICAAGATSPSQCKYDAFRVDCGGSSHQFPTVAGGKYYDANGNGVLDGDEPGLAGWPIHYSDAVDGTLFTDGSGAFTVTLVPDTYVFNEVLATSTAWMQTGNLSSQANASGGATVTLDLDKTYTVVAVEDGVVDGLYFGNLCLGAGGGLTLGFWSNKNGAALVTAADLAALTALNLRNASGGTFDPASYSALRTWLLGATATNMAYMLSAQLAAMALNVRHGLVAPGALVYAPGAGGSNANGFITVAALLDEADATLGVDGNAIAGDPLRPYQEALKTALDNANNNRTFVQPTPATCPAPF